MCNICIYIAYKLHIHVLDMHVKNTVSVVCVYLILYMDNIKVYLLLDITFNSSLI